MTKFTINVLDKFNPGVLDETDKIQIVVTDDAGNQLRVEKGTTLEEFLSDKTGPFKDLSGEEKLQLLIKRGMVGPTADARVKKLVREVRWFTQARPGSEIKVDPKVKEKVDAASPEKGFDIEKMPRENLEQLGEDSQWVDHEGRQHRIFPGDPGDSLGLLRKSLREFHRLGGNEGIGMPKMEMGPGFPNDAEQEIPPDPRYTPPEDCSFWWPDQYGWIKKIRIGWDFSIHTYCTKEFLE